MALDVLPDEIVVRNRTELLASMTGAYLVKRPSDIINDGTMQNAILASVADVTVSQSLNARTLGRQIPISEKAGVALDRCLAELQLPPRRGETGSTGYVVISTSGGGVVINEGDALTEPNSKVSFEAAVTGAYDDGDAVPIRATSTGPSTNFDAATVLQWSSPAAGLATNCTVQAPGLKGGRYSEDDEQVRLRISDALADPAASGNAATYIRLAENALGHGVPVQKAFAYVAPHGSGTIGIAFLLTPAGPGSSRIPTSAQIAAVRAYIKTVPEDETRIPPGDDLLLDTTIVSQPVSIVLDVRWRKGSANWKDSSRWPLRRDTGAGAIKVTAATDATHFTVARDDGNYAGETQPVAGQTVALYNKTTGSFARKRILSFTGTGPWVITVDTSNDSSDTTYVPIVGQRVSPWSESLDDLAQPILDRFDTLGPGEQTDTFFDPGQLQRRTPASPEFWPSMITSHLATDILNVPSVGNAIVREGLGDEADPGVLGVLAYQLELGDIAAFPL